MLRATNYIDKTKCLIAFLKNKFAQVRIHYHVTLWKRFTLGLRVHAVISKAHEFHSNTRDTNVVREQSETLWKPYQRNILLFSLTLIICGTRMFNFGRTLDMESSLLMNISLLFRRFLKRDLSNKIIHILWTEQTLKRGSNTIFGSSFSHFENGATPRSLSISCKYHGHDEK